MRTFCSLLLGFTAGLPLADATSLTKKNSGLLESSPFGAMPVGKTREAADEPLEFCAILDESGTLYFSVHNAYTHRSSWLGLNETVNGLSARTFDSVRKILTIEYRGKTLSLPLKRAGSFAAGGPTAPSVPFANETSTPAMSASEAKAVALELEKYKKLSAMAAAARQREILEHPARTN